MTGQDIKYWLDDLWFDLLNFGQADVLSLIFRLFILFVVIIVLWGIAEKIIKKLSKIIIEIWRFILIPIRFPVKILRERKRREENRKQQEEWDKSQKNNENWNIIEKKNREDQRLREIEEIKKALRLD